jgi:uncharacterized protein
MLSVDLRSLGNQAAIVSGTLGPDDEVWSEGDVRPDRPITVGGRLSGAGGGRYYFTGHFEGTAMAECRRCLVAVPVTAADDVQCLFVEESDEEGLDDDPDVYPIDPRARALDLRPAIREAWILAVPAYVVCRAECRGLCLLCGVDRNTMSCARVPAGEPCPADLAAAGGAEPV